VNTIVLVTDLLWPTLLHRSAIASGLDAVLEPEYVGARSGKNDKARAKSDDELEVTHSGLSHSLDDEGIVDLLNVVVVWIGQ
jgi:hypothetical protein